MAKKKTSSRPRPAQPRPVAPAAQAKAAAAPPPAKESSLLVTLRFAFLLVALGATALLVAKHFNLFSPPGCGAGGGCDKAAASVYGKVPGTSWPVSSVGFAFFLAMTLALAVTRGAVTPAMKHMARLGGLASAFYVFIMVSNLGEYLCVYCLTSHLANFGFLATIELARGVTPKGWSMRTVGTAAAAFLLSTGGLAIAEQAAEGKRQKGLGSDIANMIARTQQNQQTAPTTPPTTPTQTTPTPQPPTTPTPAPAPTPPVTTPAPANQAANEALLARARNGVDYRTWTPAEWSAHAAKRSLPVDIDADIGTPVGFTGRYRVGPAQAPIRIVAFSDYQCPDCKKVEAQIEEVLRERADVSFSHKHFPFNRDCNPHYKSARSPHPNACWAARAAELAGLLRGNRGFWEMHFWLFERGGGFTDAEMTAALREMNYEPAAFQQLMKDDRFAPLIAADADEGMSLGLMFTPLMFINGVELKSWNAMGAVRQAVDALAAVNPAPADASRDVPPTAFDKYITDWQQGFRFDDATLERGSTSFPRGTTGSPLRVIVWGDLQEPQTRRAVQVVMDRYRTRGDVTVEYRHYPFHEDCNPFAEVERNQNACEMAAALELAGQLGGTEAYWGLFDWILENAETYTQASMLEKARALGLDPEKIRSQLDAFEILQNVARDAATVRNKIGARSIPCLVINGRWVPRIELNGDLAPLKKMLDLAEQEAGLKAANP